MAEGRSREAWGHTSHLLCLIANVNRDPKKSRPFRPEQFNPHAAPKRVRRRVSVEALTRAILRVAEVKGKGR